MYGDEAPAENQIDSQSALQPPAPPRDAVQITLEEVVRPAAIAGMLTCIAIALSQFVSTISLNWPGRFFVILVFLVSLESIHAQRLLSRRNVSEKDQARFRFVEWVVILMIVRLGVYLGRGWGALVADLSRWSDDLMAFLDPGFLSNAVLVAIFWAAAMSLSAAFQELEAAPIERMPSVTDPDFYLRSTMPHHGLTDRRSRLNRIVNVFFAGGVAILLLAGLSQVDVRNLVLLEPQGGSGVVLNALAYFLIGLLLTSHAQYTILKATWDLQGVPTQGSIGQRWLLLAIGFLLLVGLVAALLPVSYSVGILDAGSMAVQWVGYAILQFVFLIVLIVTTVLGWFAGLFISNEAIVRETPAPAATPPPPPPVQGVEGSLAWLEVLRTLVFWGVLIGVVVYSLFHFVGDRWGIVRAISMTRLFGWLARAWRAVRRSAAKAIIHTRENLARRWADARARAPKVRPWRFVSLRGMSPRERVRYYYLSTLHRGAQQGIVRPPSMTPLEYQDQLVQAIPELSREVRALSLAFIEARYTEHAIDNEEVGAAETVWRAIKRALLARRRSSTAPVMEDLPAQDNGARP